VLAERAGWLDLTARSISVSTLCTVARGARHSDADLAPQTRPLNCNYSRRYGRCELSDDSQSPLAGSSSHEAPYSDMSLGRLRFTHHPSSSESQRHLFKGTASPTPKPGEHYIRSAERIRITPPMPPIRRSPRRGNRPGNCAVYQTANCLRRRLRRRRQSRTLGALRPRRILMLRRCSHNVDAAPQRRPSKGADYQSARA
jgi:hypothetical protein